MPHIVRLLGGARSTVRLPPALPGEERWGLNAHGIRKHMGDHREWTRWFDVHSKEHIQLKRPAAWKWFAAQTAGVIYLRDAHEEIPQSRAFPYDALMAHFGTEEHGPERYFLSSFDWMMALALMTGFEVIHVHYFQMCNTHYKWQLPSARYWVSRARGMGVKVIVHPPSELLPCNLLYGKDATLPEDLIQY